MLHPEEQQLLIWATSTQYQGFGAVVDLGPWLGGSSVALAHGLRERGRPGRVHSFDLFRWDPGYMHTYFSTDLKEGDDFQPLFQKLTASYADRIAVQQMDLTEGKWNGGPIEILFVDAAKSWGLWRSILRVFGPHLEPGKSRVIHQDFRHPTCAWLPFTCDSRPDIWQQTEATHHGSTVTFTPRRRLRAEDADDLVREDLPWQTRKELLQRRIAAEPATAWMYRVTLYAEAVSYDDTAVQQQLASELAADRRREPQAAALIDQAVSWKLIDAGWRACGAGNYDDGLRFAEQVAATSVALPFALQLAAHASRATHRLADAERLIGSSIALCPEAPSPRVEQMWLRVYQQRFADGEAIGRQVLADPSRLDVQNHVAARRVMAVLLGHQGKFDEALQENARGQNLTERSYPQYRAELLVDRARLLKAQGRNADAAAAAKQALELQPGHAGATALFG